MKKNSFVLTNMDQILDALTRGLDLNILTRGYGVENRGIVVSYQAQTPALSAVLPSNSPGVHTLWMRFAIDVVFLDSRGIVLEVAANVAPWRFALAPPRARYVLELDANRSASCGIVAGRTIVFESP